MQRESVSVGETLFSSVTPVTRFSEEEKKVSVIKAPHYKGIGPVDESGLPLAIRTVSVPEPGWALGWTRVVIIEGGSGVGVRVGVG